MESHPCMRMCKKGVTPFLSYSVYQETKSEAGLSSQAAAIDFYLGHAETDLFKVSILEKIGFKGWRDVCKCFDYLIS